MRDIPNTCGDNMTVMLAAAVGGEVVTAYVMMVDASVTRWPGAVL
jgi:hypothetical protein